MLKFGKKLFGKKKDLAKNSADRMVLEKYECYYGMNKTFLYIMELHDYWYFGHVQKSSKPIIVSIK